MGCLAAMLLTPAGASALPRPNSANAHPSDMASPSGYLAVVGAPQLRFQTKTVVAEAVAKAPDAPVAALSKSSSSPHNDFISPKIPGTADNATEPSSVILPEKTVATTPAPAVKSPPAIIQDDLRPTARAEDFLPYFQMPGSARSSGDVTLLTPGLRSAPAPAAIPPSSATYTQTPK